MENSSISSTLEDYLEAIAELSDTEEHAHSKALAEKLGVRMSSVANALQSLQVRGLINYQPHQPVTLTATGAERANVIRNRHAVMRRFFQDILKLEDSEADKTACRVEHVMNEKVMSRFVALANAIEARPDCNGLRDFLNECMPQLTPDDSAELVRLNELEDGQIGMVVKVDESLRGLKKFSDLGLVRGSLIELEGHAPFGDLIRIRVLSSSLSIRASDAAHIWLRLTDA